jgi:hypothetical protein
MMRLDASAAAKLLSMTLATALLASCGQQQPSPSSPPAKTPQSEIDEVNALVQAVKDNPSVKDPSKAGPPIHVDPYPKAGGKHDHDMPMNNMTH